MKTKLDGWDAVRGVARNNGARGAPSGANRETRPKTATDTITGGLAELAQHDGDDVLRSLAARRSGLAEAEVEERRERVGRNEVAHERSPRRSC